MTIDRPLDVLQNLKGGYSRITLLSGQIVEGIFVTFDIHINLVLAVKGIPKFIKGDNILFVEKIAEVKE